MYSFNYKLTKEQLNFIQDYYYNTQKKQIIKPIEQNKVIELIYPDRPAKELTFANKVRLITLFMEYIVIKQINIKKELDELFENVEDDIPQEPQPQEEKIEESLDKHHKQYSMKEGVKAKPKRKKRVKVVNKKPENNV